MGISPIRESTSMEKIALAIIALLAFLVPVGTYCLILATINRRSRPLFVSGLWDAVGLLFATSGFFLVGVPMLLTEFFNRTMGIVVQDTLWSAWLQYWLVWLVYFLLLGTGAALMLLTRTRKTLIYNIDADLFDKGLETALAGLGLAGAQERGRLVLTAAPITPSRSLPGRGPASRKRRRRVW
jgi:hypothetical protein